MGIRDQELGFGIGIWVCGLVFRFEIGEQDWALWIGGFGIGIGDLDRALRIRIEDYNWGFGFWIGDW